MSKGSKKGENIKSKGKIFFPLLVSLCFCVKFSFSEGKIEIIKGPQPVIFQTGFQFHFSPHPDNDNQQDKKWGFAYDYSLGTYTTDSHPDSEKWNRGTISYYTLGEGTIASNFENSFRFKITKPPGDGHKWVAKITKGHDPRLKNNQQGKGFGFGKACNNMLNITWVLMKRTYGEDGLWQDDEIAVVSGFHSVVENISLEVDPNGNVIYWIKYIAPWPVYAGDYEASDHAFSINIEKKKI